MYKGKEARSKQCSHCFTCSHEPLKKGCSQPNLSPAAGKHAANQPGLQTPIVCYSLDTAEVQDAEQAMLPYGSQE